MCSQFGLKQTREGWTAQTSEVEKEKVVKIPKVGAHSGNGMRILGSLGKIPQVTESPIECAR